MLKFFKKVVFLLLIPSVFYSQTRPLFKAPKDSYLTATDLHIHTVFSDGSVWPDIRLREALREGLDLIAMTDHLEYQPHKEDIPHPDRNRSYQIASELAKGQEDLLHKPVRLYSFTQKFYVTVFFLKVQCPLLINYQTTSSIYIIF